MIHIVKGQEPLVLKNYKRINGEKANYQDFRDKDIVTKQLLEEQGYLCVYCMEHIGSDENKWTQEIGIEHYRSKKNFPELQLEYTNMLVVCKISKGKPIKETHCDVLKGNSFLNFNPQIKEHIEKLSYVKGNLESSNTTFNHEIQEILGLNRGYLPSNRINALNNAIMIVHKKFAGNINNISTLEKIINSQNKVDNNGYKKAYCGIIIDYFTKKIKEIKPII